MKVGFELDFQHCVTKFSIEESQAYCRINGPVDCNFKNAYPDKPHIETKFYCEQLKSKETSIYYAEVITYIVNAIIIPLDNNKMIQIYVYVINFEIYGLLAALNSVFVNLMVAGIPMKNIFYATGANHDFMIYDQNEILLFEHILKDRPTIKEEIKQAVISAVTKINTLD